MTKPKFPVIASIAKKSTGLEQVCLKSIITLGESVHFYILILNNFGEITGERKHWR
jgi:hypothetical protein